MRFLCHKHRQTIFTSPHNALHYWEQWMNKASTLMQQQQWNKATDYLGGCFEISEWLLQQIPINDNNSVNTGYIREQIDYCERYLLAGHSLAECLDQNRLHDVELQYLLQIHQYLLSMAESHNTTNWRFKQFLKMSLHRLQGFSKQHGRFSAYGYYQRRTEYALSIGVQ